MRRRRRQLEAHENSRLRLSARAKPQAAESAQQKGPPAFPSLPAARMSSPSPQVEDATNLDHSARKGKSPVAQLFARLFLRLLLILPAQVAEVAARRVLIRTRDTLLLDGLRPFLAGLLDLASDFRTGLFLVVLPRREPIK